MKIMIVEDDPKIAEPLQSYIHKYGFQAVKVSEFHAVMDAFHEHLPDLVLLDINLPSYDGYYWCRQIRKGSICPVVFYFGKSRRNGNARTFFLVAVISTVAFSAIGTLYGFQSFLTAGLSTSSPNTFTYYADDNEEQDVALINETLQEEHIKANKPVFKSVAVIGLLYRLGQRLRKTPCPG